MGEARVRSDRARVGNGCHYVRADEGRRHVARLPSCGRARVRRARPTLPSNASSTCCGAPIEPCGPTSGWHRDGALSGANGNSESGKGRPEALDRDEIRPAVRTPREALRTYWAWVELTHGERWARRAAELAKQIVVSGVHEAVITSAPPHTSHEAGRVVSEATGLPFVMDMRDPWSLQPWLRESIASPIWYRHAERFERGCIDRAALVVANTAPAHTALVSRYPEAAAKIITAMNGSDEDPLPPHRDSEQFLIRYAGTIYLDRDPQTLFRAAAKVIAREHLEPAQFGIDILGRFADEHRVPLLAMAAQEGIAEYVTVEPPRPHKEALQFLAGATMLVIFLGSNMLALPAKVFEYVRFDSWLLALAEPGSAIAQVLEGTTRRCRRTGDRSDGGGHCATLSRSSRGHTSAACGDAMIVSVARGRHASFSTRSSVSRRRVCDRALAALERLAAIRRS